MITSDRVLVAFAAVFVCLALVMAGLPLLAADPFAVEVPLSADGVQRASVEADSYSFTPGHLVVKAGKPVELTFKSVTWLVPHNLIIDDPRSGLTIREEIPAGGSVTVKFTPAVAGTFAIYCDKKLPFFKSHREKGQEGTLEVRP
jgi:plastocyanin